MSAAEPAPTPPPLTGAGRAAVIPILDRARRQAGRGPQVTDTDGLAPGERSAQALLADKLETLFNAEELSLTDERIATAYRVTLEIVRGMLEGALAQGIVDEGQRVELDQILEGMVDVPRLV